MRGWALVKVQAPEQGTALARVQVPERERARAPAQGKVLGQDREAQAAAGAAREARVLAPPR